MCDLYSSVVQADLDASDIVTAEFVKVAENTYRDVQIAFANEISIICDHLGIDVWTTRELINKVPYRDMHRPGGGVGGHCLPKDPWLLAAAAPVGLTIIPAAREVNDAMPSYVADQVLRRIKAWQDRDGHSGLVAVAVLGYSYLPQSDDTRNTPSQPLVDELVGRGLEVRVHDPFVPAYNVPVESILDGCQAVVVMVPHAEYDNLPLSQPVVLRVGQRA
jgi:UDP-N-acetyl-D-mannosaminuronic acid dehydrogenase